MISRIMVSGILLSISLLGSDNKLLLWSQVAVVGSGTMDTIVSYNQVELNPLLRDSRGRFNGKGIAVKWGIIGGSILSQRLVDHKLTRKQKRKLVVINMVITGVITSITIRNHMVKH